MKYQMYITLAGENKIAAFSINDFGKPTLQFKKTIPGKPAPLVIDKNKKFYFFLKIFEREFSTFFQKK